MEIERKKQKTDPIVILSYIGILCLIPLLSKKDDKFAQFHAKQGLVLFIAEIATMFIAWIPIIGWLIGFIAWIIWMILSIMGIINVVHGDKQLLPVLGKLLGKVDM